MLPVISNIRPSAPATATGTGSLLFDVAYPDGLLNLLVQQQSYPGLVVFSTSGVPAGANFAVADLTPGVYVITVYGVGAVGADAYALATVGPYVVPVRGCTDPDADNYDPAAVVDDGSCVITPRLGLAGPIAPLVANGRPIWIELNSPEISGNVPAPARAVIDLSALAGTAGVGLTVNGYRLLSGPVLLATNFVDAPSLAEALAAIAPLAADYLIELSGANAVQLTARAVGTAGNLAIATTAPARIAIATVPGVNRWRSQARSRWGCYLEIWTGAPGSNPSTFSDLYTDSYRDRYGLLVPAPPTVALPVLAQRIELNYRADNAYRFDIAPALRQFTGHAYPQAGGECPDRLVSYFLKFGELYADAASIRRQRNQYVSPVGWALDAVEIVAPFAANCYLLSRRPGPWRSFGTSAAPTVLLGNQPGPASYAAQLSATRFDGASSTAPGPTVAQGRVTRLALPDAFFSGALRGAASIDAGGPVALPPLDLLKSGDNVLTFANGQGGFDTIVFEGVREEITKRASANYATPTGSATRVALLPEPFRLHSGLMTRAEWLWLRRELGNSPSAWLENAEGPEAVTLTAYAAEADEVLGVYTVNIDCEPQTQPVYGLTN